MGSLHQDLVDRSIILELPVISEENRKPDRDIKNKFEAAKPKILGAIFDSMVGTLRELPSIYLDRKPRMADFAMSGVALEKALDWERGSFMRGYLSHQKEAAISSLENCLIITALVEYMGSNAYEGTYKKLYQVLTDRYRAYRIDWPKSVKDFAGVLKRQKPALNLLGFEMVSRVRKNDGIHILIKNNSKEQIHDVHEVHKGTSDAPFEGIPCEDVNQPHVSSQHIHKKDPESKRFSEHSEHENQEKIPNEMAEEREVCFL